MNTQYDSADCAQLYSDRQYHDLSKRLNVASHRIAFEKWLLQSFSPSSAQEADFLWHGKVIALLCTKNSEDSSSQNKEDEDQLIAEIIACAEPPQAAKSAQRTTASEVHQLAGKQLYCEPICSAVRSKALPRTCAALLKTMLQHQTLEEVFIQAVDSDNSSLIRSIREAFLEKLPSLCRKICCQGDQLPLFSAIQSNNLELVTMLMRAYPEQALFQKKGFTSLHAALEKGNFEIAKQLIEAFPALAAVQDRTGKTPLHYAVVKGNLEIIKLIALSFPSAAANQPEIAKILTSALPGSAALQNSNGISPAHVAAGHNAQAFFAAVENNNVLLAKDLITASPELAVLQTEGGFTALHYAAQKGYEEMAKILFEACPSSLTVQTNMGDTALHIAVREKNMTMSMRLLAAAPAAAMMRNAEKATPLQLAIKMRAWEMASALAKAFPASVAVENKGGRCVLEEAIASRQLECVQALVEAFPEIALVQNSAGNTPLGFAMVAGNQQIIEFLVTSAPASAAVQNKEGITPLHQAVKGGALEVVKHIVKSNPELVAAQDKEGFTALHFATSKGNLEIIKVLAEAFPEALLIQEKNGCTALHVASRKNFLEIATLLAALKPEVLFIRDNGGTHSYAGIKRLRLKGFEKLTALYKSHRPSKEIDQIIKERKALAHTLHLEGKSEIKSSAAQKPLFTLDLEGYSTSAWYHMMKKNLGDLQHAQFLTEQQKGWLEQLFDMGENPNAYSHAETIARIEAGRPVVITTGFLGHVAMILVWKDQFLICNRGAMHTRPVEFYHLGKKIENEILEQIEKINLSGDRGDYDSLIQYYLPDKLALKKNSFDEKLESAALLPDQIVDNCSLVSPLTQVYALLLLGEMYGGREDPSALSEEEFVASIEKVIKAYQGWLSIFQVGILESNLRRKEEPYAIDHQLILQALRKVHLLPLTQPLKEKLDGLISEYLSRLPSAQRTDTLADLAYWKTNWKLNVQGDFKPYQRALISGDLAAWVPKTPAKSHSAAPSED
jgi:ankyrin repeat protein